MNPRFSTALSWLVTLIMPVVLILLGVRLMLTPLYPTLAYNMPGFPSDSYGFNKDDRLHWSQYAIEYLINDAGIQYLGDLKFPDGKPLYNERELSHMLDVKILVQTVLKVFYVSLAVLIALGLWAWSGKWMDDYRRGVSRGGWLTVILIVGMGIFAVTSFWDFFTKFHEIFFTGDTWLFYFSDTLIRLFPMRFWQDVFIWVLGLAIVMGAALGYFMKPKAKERVI
jgi:integral membrane protein (TIGR01906 family)